MFRKVQDLAVTTLAGAARMRAELNNPLLIDLSDLGKAQAQIAVLAGLKNDTIQVGMVLHKFYGRIADFLGIPQDQLLSVEDMIEGAEKLAAAMPAAAPGGQAEPKAETEASGAKYRDAIRKAVGNTFTGVGAKGGNVFSHDDGAYFLGFCQKSGSTAKELKFSINKDVVAELRTLADGHLYLVGKDGLIADVAVAELDGKEVEASRYEFFVSVADDAVTKVAGNRRAFDLPFDQFSVGVTGSAE